MSGQYPYSNYYTSFANTSNRQEGTNLGFAGGQQPFGHAQHPVQNYQAQVMYYGLPNNTVYYPQMNAPNFQHNWQGYPLQHRAPVDVTRSSKINYDDDDDDEKEDNAHDIVDSENINESKGTEVRSSKEEKEGNEGEDEQQQQEQETEEEDIYLASPKPKRQKGSLSCLAKELTEKDMIRSDAEDVDGHFLKSQGEEKETPVIQGTAIVLKSEEDIRIWREERRKMWLIKISNRRAFHREQLNIKEDEIKRNPFHEARKEKNFIQNIQNQVKRYNSKPSLSTGLFQRSLKDENMQILDFIKELGDAGVLNYELTDKEKDILFGSRDRKYENKKHFPPNERRNRNISSSKIGKKRTIHEI